MPLSLFSYSEDALYFTDTFGGVSMGIVPILLLRRSSASGNQNISFVCGWYAHSIIQNLITAILIFSAFHTITAQFRSLIKS